MEIQFQGDLVHPIASDTVLLSQTAVQTCHAMFQDLKAEYGDQEWDENYWLKLDGELIYCIKGEIPEAMNWVRIGSKHWNITGSVH